MKTWMKLPCVEAAVARAVAEGGWWHETSSFRRFLPQLIATVVNNLLMMDMNMMLFFPSLLTGALRLNKAPDEDGLRLDAEQAKWVGSLVYIFMPLGSLVSGWVMEPIGRRRGMLLANVPPLAGWLLLRFSRSVPMLYAANALLGLGVGFMEAPLLCYVGEISEPGVRTLLMAFAAVMAQVGYLLVYMLAITLPWRTAATVCATIPVMSALLMLMVPESPLWLLARGREAEAHEALRWLRGWVRPEMVQNELGALADYAHHTHFILQRAGGGCRGTAREMLRGETQRPLLLVVVFFLLFHASGMSGVIPYIMSLTESIILKNKSTWIVVLSVVLGILSALALIPMVTRMGKRRLTLGSVAVWTGACVLLGACRYAGSLISENSPMFWLPFTIFIALSFFTYFCLGQMPLMYVAEVLPLRTRAVASGVAATCEMILYFSAIKTYIKLEEILDVYGVFGLYAAWGAIGFFFLYRYLPETEGKSLSQVEALFTSPHEEQEQGPRLHARL